MFSTRLIEEVKNMYQQQALLN